MQKDKDAADAMVSLLNLTGNDKQKHTRVFKRRCGRCGARLLSASSGCFFYH